MKITSASVAAAGLALLPAAAVADNNLQCSRHTVTNKQAAYSTTQTLHRTAYPVTTVTQRPVATYTPMTTIYYQLPTAGVGKAKPKTIVVDRTIRTNTQTTTVTDATTVRLYRSRTTRI